MSTLEKQRSRDNAVFEDGEWWIKDTLGGRARLEAIRRKRAKHTYTTNKINNCKSMYVNNKYVKKTHPLYKAGRYKTFDDAAFSSLVNYEQTIEGDVYIITNAAWPEWVKIGKAIDAKDRLKGYQTSDPYRDYKLYHHKAHANRHIAETGAHKALEKLSKERKNEWFKVDLKTAVSCVEASYENI